MTSPWTLPLILVGIAPVSVMIRLMLTARWHRTTAEVIYLSRPYSPTDDSRVDATMLPTIRFTTVTGAIVIFEDKKLRLGPVMIGDQIEILYSPIDSSQVTPTAFLKRFKLEIIPLVLGLFLLFILPFRE